MKHRTSTQWLDFRRLNDRNYCDTWLVGRLMQRYSIHQVARHYKAICGASDTLEAVYQESVRNPAAMEWMMRFNPAVGCAA